ncbi:Lrp/AsnC family transcriptional regulator [Caenispirillum bisanense]|uniref:siroheme decarboxylase n=1 Tax=Caenispirillum bisanense TaxID=414052 RepID=A0A286G8Y1_9PROT|nr:AsnC family transcriptional regulator [Caenispirillum bisanense]SOD91922.1 transcriptional regulator, AsnC family [Caenispirillum bisanense]
MTTAAPDLDRIDRAIINALQGGFPLCDRPYAAAAAPLGLSEAELIERLASLRTRGVLTRFGPLWKPEALGGEAVLAAMTVPADRFDEVAGQVNAFPEVAHNYARDHALNMWFVVAAETPERARAACDEIAAATGLAVLPLPKLHEFHLDLRLVA